MNVALTPQQQMVLEFAGFPAPEVQPQTTISRGKVVDRYLAFTIREDGAWVEFLGYSPVDAVEKLVREISRNRAR